MKTSIRFLFLISTLFFGISQSVSAGSLTAKISNDKIGLNEPFYLMLNYSGDDAQEFSEPDLSALTDYVDLVGRQQGISAHQVNDDYKVEVKLVYEFLPKKTGVFTIPSFYAGNNTYTTPYEITVSESKSAPENIKSDIKKEPLKMTTDKNWFVLIGGILFVLGGLLFTTTALLVLIRKMKKEEKK